MEAILPTRLAEAPDLSGIGDRRTAPWLLASYLAPQWTVRDTRDPDRTAVIDFDYPLADGRSLLDAERLVATVREYAWWVRDPRYSRIDDAVTHSLLVRNVIHLAHALSMRRLSSFAQLQPYDVEQLVEECRFGLDAVLHATDRVSAHLAAIERANAGERYGGLPVYTFNGRETATIHATKVVTACHLPVSAAGLPGVAAVMAATARRNGMISKSKLTETPPVARNMTSQALQRWLDPLEQMYAMRRRMEAESIPFKPFPRGAGRVAAVKGVATQRTPTVPPRLALHLIAGAFTWIDENEARISNASTIPDRRTVQLFATACWILIAAFTARRDEEIDDLRSGCLDGNATDGWWLQVYIEKTLQRKEWVPIPAIVARAVAALTTLSASAREATGTPELFQWLDGDDVVHLDVGRLLDDFAAAVATPMHVPRGAPAVAWHWHPHQFRRFFAILYFYRFEGATIEALSHHLRHFSLEMTRRYVTKDSEVASLWTDVEWGYVGDVARSIASGERSVAGAMGDRLKKVVERLRGMFDQKLRVVSPERLGSALSMVMQRQGLVLTPKPWVTCSCPRTAAAALSAACRREGALDVGAIGPDFAHAGPGVCPSCPHAILEGDRTAMLADEAAHLSAASAAPSRAGTMLGMLESARLVAIEKAAMTRFAPVSAARPIGNLEEVTREN